MSITHHYTISTDFPQDVYQKTFETTARHSRPAGKAFNLLRWFTKMFSQGGYRTEHQRSSREARCAIVWKQRSPARHDEESTTQWISGLWLPSLSHNKLLCDEWLLQRGEVWLIGHLATDRTTLTSNSTTSMGCIFWWRNLDCNYTTADVNEKMTKPISKYQRVAYIRSSRV